MLEKYFRETTSRANADEHRSTLKCRRGFPQVLASRGAGWPSASPTRTTRSRKCSCCSSSRTMPPTASIAPSSRRDRRRTRCSSPSCARMTRSARRAMWTLTRRAHVYPTRADKCQSIHVVADSNWEQKMAETLEEMDEVVCYVKNQPGLYHPLHLNGEERKLHARLYRARQRWARRRMIC